jgi:hypothetical protein
MIAPNGGDGANSGAVGGTEVPPASPEVYDTSDQTAVAVAVDQGGPPAAGTTTPMGIALIPTDRDVVLGGADGIGRVSGMLVEDLVRYHHLLWTVSGCIICRCISPPHSPPMPWSF